MLINLVLLKVGVEEVRNLDVRNFVHILCSNVWSWIVRDV